MLSSTEHEKSFINTQLQLTSGFTYLTFEGDKSYSSVREILLHVFKLVLNGGLYTLKSCNI